VSLWDWFTCSSTRLCSNSSRSAVNGLSKARLVVISIQIARKTAIFKANGITQLMEFFSCFVPDSLKGASVWRPWTQPQKCPIKLTKQSRDFKMIWARIGLYSPKTAERKTFTQINSKHLQFQTPHPTPPQGLPTYPSRISSSPLPSPRISGNR